MNKLTKKQIKEEILNTPVEFKEGMRVFELIEKKWGFICSGDDADYPVMVKYDSGDDNGDETDYCYTIGGKHYENRPYRSLLTEQEAYELFPSLKPKVYEYQVVYEFGSTFCFSEIFCTSKEEFREKYKNERCVFIELYQPSKRERKA